MRSRQPRAAVPARQPESSKGGRPRFDPTLDQRRIVELGAGFGIPHEELRRAVINPHNGRPIDAKTLREHFSEELANGRVKVKITIAGALLAGTKMDAATRIFLGKTVLGLREVSPKEEEASETIVVKGGLPDGD